MTRLCIIPLLMFTMLSTNAVVLIPAFIAAMVLVLVAGVR